ncbi:MAG TPA: response regulator [Flavitalea sp.]|nr:response regulator [Flavitalea sp.]
MKNIKQWLLIDDDLDDQEIFLMALKDVDEGIECFVANNGLEGLEIVNKDRSFVPECIFLDVNMPKMNGMQCLEELKKLEHLKDSSIFMFSTAADARLINQSKELGADEFLVKPPGLTSLIEVLTNIVRR